MSCFPCFKSQKSKNDNRSHHINAERSVQFDEPKAPESTKPKPVATSEGKEETPQDENSNIKAQTFTFRELATATKNFRQECLLGEGGFGRVYKGTLQSTNQVVAVKQLDRNGLQGNKEFLVEVLMLSLLHHQNLVNLIGYCADGDQRLLVYEFMPGGSVEDHLLELAEDQKPLDWTTRIKIALGAARGLEYLHDASPPVIYRDLKSSNILLDENFVPKLSDFGLAKLGPQGDKMHVSSRVMGTYGYCAPEYARSGHLTVKSDVYSFGVVLLELITGRRVIDNTRPVDEQNLVAWAQPIFRDPKKYPTIADPLLKKQFSEKGLNQAVAIAAMCLQEEAAARPLMNDVVIALTFLSKDTEDIPPLPPDPVPEPDDGNEDDEEYTDEDEYSNEYDEDGSYQEDEEPEEIEDETKAGSSNQQDKNSSVVDDQDKEGSKDEIRKSSSRKLPSSKRSEVLGASSRKTSNKLKSASTQKSRVKADGSDPSTENKRSKSLSVPNQESRKKAKDGSVSSRSKSSSKSKSRSESSRHKSIKKTPEEISQTSSTLLASTEESQNSTRELPDKTAPASQEKKTNP